MRRLLLLAACVCVACMHAYAYASSRRSCLAAARPPAVATIPFPRKGQQAAGSRQHIRPGRHDHQKLRTAAQAHRSRNRILDRICRDAPLLSVPGREQEQSLHAVVLRPFRALLSPFSKPTTPTWHGAAGLAFGAHAAARRGRAPTEPGRWVGRGALGRSLLDTAPRAVSPAAALHRPAAGPVVFCCLHCLHVPMRAHATHTTCCYNAMRQYIS
jgi:hypothetical protein